MLQEYFIKVQELLKNNNVEGAIEVVNERLAENSKDADALNTLGILMRDFHNITNSYTQRYIHYQIKA